MEGGFIGAPLRVFSAHKTEHILFFVYVMQTSLAHARCGVCDTYITIIPGSVYCEQQCARVRVIADLCDEGRTLSLICRGIGSVQVHCELDDLRCKSSQSMELTVEQPGPLDVYFDSPGGVLRANQIRKMTMYGARVMCALIHDLRAYGRVTEWPDAEIRRLIWDQTYCTLMTLPARVHTVVLKCVDFNGGWFDRSALDGVVHLSIICPLWLTHIRYPPSLRYLTLENCEHLTSILPFAEDNLKNLRMQSVPALTRVAYSRSLRAIICCDTHPQLVIPFMELEYLHVNRIAHGLSSLYAMTCSSGVHLYAPHMKHKYLTPERADEMRRMREAAIYITHCFFEAYMQPPSERRPAGGWLYRKYLASYMRANN